MDLPAQFLELVANRGVDHGGEDHAGIGGDAGDNPFDLAQGPYQPPGMGDRFDEIELDETGSRDGGNGFSGGIGHEVQVETL
jgi:hypothetical protein